jgi:hypothetical protein
MWWIVIPIGALFWWFLFIRGNNKNKDKDKNTETPLNTEGTKTDDNPDASADKPGDNESQNAAIIKPKASGIKGIMDKIVKFVKPDNELVELVLPYTKGKKGEKIYPPTKAYVYNDIIGRCGPTILTSRIVGQIIQQYHSLGRPLNHNGEDIPYLIHTEDDKYKPCIFPYSEINSSNILHRAMQHPEIPIVWDVKPEKSFVEKYGMFMLFAGVIIFFMFISSTS